MKPSLNKFLTRQEQFLLAGLACALILGSGIIWLDRGRKGLFIEEPAPPPLVPQPGEITPSPAAPPVDSPVPVKEPPPEVQPRQIRVDITGAVNRPGVYTFVEGTIVDDALKAAGGSTEEAEIAAVNRAAPLIDGSQLLVPKRTRFGRLEPSDAEFRPYGARVTPGDAGRTEVEGDRKPVDINRANMAELQTLSGIGSVKAREIIMFRRRRPFRQIEDLLEVKGIGPKTLESLRDRVTVGSLIQ